MIHRAPLCPALIALALAGCGAGHQASAQLSLGRSFTGAAGTRALVTAAPAPVGDPSPERGGTVPAAAVASLRSVAANGLAPSPQVALVRYALAYINWTAADLPQRERQLATMAVGAAKLTAEQIASAQSGATALRADHVSNRGTVIAIAAGRGADRGAWVVVTQEQTTGSGPYAAVSAGPHLTLARVAHLPGGWAVSSWQPLT